MRRAKFSNTYGQGCSIGLTYDRVVKLCDISILSLPGDLHSIWQQVEMMNRGLWSLDITNMYFFNQNNLFLLVQLNERPSKYLAAWSR